MVQFVRCTTGRNELHNPSGLSLWNVVNVEEERAGNWTGNKVKELEVAEMLCENFICRSNSKVMNKLKPLIAKLAVGKRVLYVAAAIIRSHSLSCRHAGLDIK